MSNKALVRTVRFKGAMMIEVLPLNEESNPPKPKRFPITRLGCRRAGEFLHKIGSQHHSFSDDVHRTTELDNGDTFVVQDLIMKGFEKAEALMEKHRVALAWKMVSWCSQTNFLETLTPHEHQAFDEFTEELNKLSK